jgi:polyhydroxyalkanoate synthesis repressor PhaR
MNDTATIELRRYPSRKLYNKTASAYVRLPEVAEMIRSGAVIRVEDTETGEDVTRQVLLQIIMEQENHSDRAMLSADMMMDMIRLHQSKASELMTGLFEQSLAFLRAQQEQIASQVSSSLAPGMGGALAPPWAMFDPAQLAQMQRDYQARLNSFWGGARKEAAAPATTPAGGEAEELKAMRARLDELERRLAER